MKSPLLWWLAGIVGVLVLFSIAVYDLIRPEVSLVAKTLDLKPTGEYLPVGSIGRIDKSTERHGLNKGQRQWCFSTEASADRFYYDVFVGDTHDADLQQESAKRLPDGTTLLAIKVGHVFGAPSARSNHIRVEVEDGVYRGVRCWIANSKYFSGVHPVKSRGR
jgi:hypothetical protein